MPSRILGIGRPRVEPASSRAWPTSSCTGTALSGVNHLATEMGQEGPLVVIAADGAAAYRDTYLDLKWLATKDLDPAPHRHRLPD